VEASAPIDGGHHSVNKNMLLGLVKAQHDNVSWPLHATPTMLSLRFLDDG